MQCKRYHELRYIRECNFECYKDSVQMKKINIFFFIYSEFLKLSHDPLGGREYITTGRPCNIWIYLF